MAVLMIMMKRVTRWIDGWMKIMIKEMVKNAERG